MSAAGLAAGFYALLAAIVIGFALWGIAALRSAGRVAQQADDATRTNEATNAMLKAGVASPHDPAALDQQLREGRF